MNSNLGIVFHVDFKDILKMQHYQMRCEYFYLLNKAVFLKQECYCF